MKKASPFVKGTLTLTASNLYSRLIGFYNRIFLAGLIGAHQMGVYQLIFPIYLVGFAFCFHGFQTALSTIVAAKKARGQTSEARRLLKVTLMFTLILSTIFTIVILLCANPLCKYLLKEDDCILCLQVAVLALPFVGIKACIHSYFLGLGQSNVPALSLCIEQTSRVLSIFAISVSIINDLPNAALVAVLGMVIGEFVSFVFTVIYFLKKRIKSLAPCHTSHRSLLKEVLSLGFPLTLNSLSVTLLQSVQSILIPMMLTRYSGNHHTSIELYGILTGMALPFIQFPSTITGSLSMMLVPKVSSAKAQENKHSLERSIRYPLAFCGLLGICAFVGFFTLGPTLGTMVFHSSQCGNYLRLLSFICPFLYVSGILTSILNGLGMTKTTLLHNSISLTIQIGFILFVIPMIGIYGYCFGLIASLIVLVTLHMWRLTRSQ